MNNILHSTHPSLNDFLGVSIVQSSIQNRNAQLQKIDFYQELQLVIQTPELVIQESPGLGAALYFKGLLINSIKKVPDERQKAQTNLSKVWLHCSS